MKYSVSKYALSAAVMSSVALGVGASRAGSTMQIVPLQAHVTQLENHTSVVYYTVLGNGDYEVVATYGSRADTQVPSTQYRVTLPVGQTASFALDQGSDAAASSSAVTITALPNTIKISGT